MQKEPKFLGTEKELLLLFSIEGERRKFQRENSKKSYQRNESCKMAEGWELRTTNYEPITSETGGDAYGQKH